MITNRLSPSSAVALDGCEMQWFFGYGLYFREPNKDANLKGTAAHSVMEAVAKSKLLRQQNKKWMKDEVFGRIYQNYEYNDLIQKSFEFYRKENLHLNWGDKDLRDLTKRCMKAYDHEAFPENYDEIVHTEQRFKLPIEEDWATFSELKDGEIKKYQLAVTGVIDLVYRQGDKLNYLDYKFGKSKPQDWNTGKEKTVDSMEKDVQLALYYWAIDKLYPGEHPTTNIWYVLTDNYWSKEFNSGVKQFAMDEIRRRFERVRGMKKPALKYSWKCKWCPYSQTKISDYTGNLKHDVPATGADKFEGIEGKKCACDAMKYFFEFRSIDLIVENLRG